MKNNPRKKIRGKERKKTTSISVAKYRMISSAILKVLTRDATRFSDVVRGVEKRVKSFSGSVAWYTVACLRDLERQKKVIRHKTKPLGYSKK